MPKVKSRPGIAGVAANALTEYGGSLYPQAVKLVCPFPELRTLASCPGSGALKAFVRKYEPKAEAGLFPHQAGLLDALRRGADNVLVTTATGSGKSLCFWAWVVDRLTRDADSTALACFPTQALMWGQAERLARVSDPASILRYGKNDTAYGGVIRLGRQSIPWTVWFGVGQGATKNAEMEEHEGTEGFKSARIRLATLDKAHWSLFRSKNAAFASQLRSVVIDEAHTYHGVFGANVHFFLRRLYVAAGLCGHETRPGVFLASATLPGAKTFAAQLLGIDEASIAHIEDATKPLVELIPLADVVDALAKPPKNCLMRIALLVDDEGGQASLTGFLEDSSKIGADANALYFSESKFQSKGMKLGLAGSATGRDAVIYDADLPPEKRREIEQRFNDPSVRGVTLLATNALELGVDIEGLDVCVLDQVPASRASLVQRAGRVGRRADRPGLILLRLSAEPHDRHILEGPVAAFRLDDARPPLLPLHLDLLRTKHALTAFREWMDRLKQEEVSWDDFNGAITEHFGFDPCPRYKDLKTDFETRFGTLVDTEGDSAWVYRGFRASASQGKIPLLDGSGEEVARIEADAVFRDAHPEAVYLGHDLCRYRVEGYDQDWKVAEWTNPASDTVLGKWLPTLRAVRVTKERRHVTTRGRWRDSFSFYEKQDLARGESRPATGQLEFGVWDYCRKWDGYVEIDLKTGGEKAVPLKDVAARFADARRRRSAFPFLHDFSYRTVGWEWTFGRVEASADLAGLVEGLLEHFLADAVESSPADLRVRLNLKAGKLQVLDAAPGGNGLSRAILADGRAADGFGRCEKQLGAFGGRGGVTRFKKYVLNLCQMEPGVGVSEVRDAVCKLRERWAG